MCEIYRIFSHDWDNCVDYTDEMKIELYNQESYGGTISQRNGFGLGKKWLSLNVTMWKEDMQRGNLFLHELYDDPKFPHWWLDKVFKKE